VSPAVLPLERRGSSLDLLEGFFCFCMGPRGLGDGDTVALGIGCGHSGKTGGDWLAGVTVLVAAGGVVGISWGDGGRLGIRASGTVAPAAVADGGGDRVDPGGGVRAGGAENPGV